MSNCPSLLDLETSLEMRRMAPIMGEIVNLDEYKIRNAQVFINILNKLSTNEYKRYDIDCKEYYAFTIEKLKSIYPIPINNKELIELCEDLFLWRIKIQTSDWILHCVAWNAAQLMTLARYFEVDLEEKDG